MGRREERGGGEESGGSGCVAAFHAAGPHLVEAGQHRGEVGLGHEEGGVLSEHTLHPHTQLKPSVGGLLQQLNQL